MRTLRSLSCLGLIGVLIGLSSLLIWVLVRFSSPQPVWIAAGKVQDYPLGQEPRLFSKEGIPFYVVNVDEELIALEARSQNHITRCRVFWQANSAAFVDPCLGTNFSQRGEYRGKGPPGELHQLPLQIRDGQVWVELGYQ